MKITLKRFFCFLMVLCLLLPEALGEGRTDEPLYRSSFTLTAVPHADGFPQDGAAHYADWEAFLKKLSVTGTMDVQRPLDMMDSYVMMDAALNVNGREVIPFHYESYGLSRYVSSPALKNDTLYFQMLNFDLFMLKPYMFMELPTTLISQIVFPEQLIWAENQFETTITSVLQGKNKAGYKKLYRLAEKLSNMVNNDAFNRYYFICYGLFSLIYGTDVAFADLGSLPDWVDMLDPDQKGMTCVKDGSDRVYSIGDTQILRVTPTGWTFSAPDVCGYVQTISWNLENGTASFLLLSTLDGEERLRFSAELTGLPDSAEALEADGTLKIEISGGAVSETYDTEKATVTVQYHYGVSSSSYPRTEELTLDLIHPTTGKSCFTVAYTAETQQISGEEVNNRRESYANLVDFFTLNSNKLEEFKQNYFKSILVSALPVAVEMPLGVIGDVVEWASSTGFLAFFGLE